jgi:hypothetical protein
MWKSKSMRLVASAADLSGGYERLARRLGVTEVEVVSWAHGIGGPSGPVAERLAELIRKSSLRVARATILTRRDHF